MAMHSERARPAPEPKDLRVPAEQGAESTQAALRQLGEQLAAARRAIAASEELYARLAGLKPAQPPSTTLITPTSSFQGDDTPRPALGRRPEKTALPEKTVLGLGGNAGSAKLDPPTGLSLHSPRQGGVPDGRGGVPGDGLEEPLLGRHRGAEERVVAVVEPESMRAVPSINSSGQPEDCSSSPRSPVATSRRNSGVHWDTVRSFLQVFPDKDHVKEELRSSLFKTQAYDVEQLYSTTGIWQKAARNDYFKNMTFVVIICNALWISIDTDYNKAAVLTDAPAVFQLVENLFCSYFFTELLIRYKAFSRKRDAFGDGWFIFDGCLVLLMVWSTWMLPLACSLFGGLRGSSVMQHTSIFRILRLFRLTRVARLTRLLKDIPELMVLIKGMMVAMRAVFSTLCLLALVIYVFAILFTEMLADSEARDGSFETVPQSVNSLLLAGVFSSQADLLQKMLAVHWVYYITMLAYAVVGSMTIMNMLIGVIVQVMQAVSEAETDGMRAQTLKDMIGRFICEHGEDHLFMSQADFREMIRAPDTARALREVNVNVLELIDLADLLFEGKDRIPRESFVEGVMTYRDDKPASSTNLMQMCRRLEERMDILTGKDLEREA